MQITQLMDYGHDTNDAGTHSIVASISLRTGSGGIISSVMELGVMTRTTIAPTSDRKATSVSLNQQAAPANASRDALDGGFL
jgi:hypothetical protein